MGTDFDSQNTTRPLDDEPDSERRLSPGTTLANRYYVEDVIGIGGMGAVYRARDLHFPNVKKWVAVKEMINQTHEIALRETMIQNFEREANILATLSHPSIPRIHDFFTDNSRCYLVLEYIYGQDLEAMLRKTSEFFKEDQVIQWGIEACDVLNFLHTHKPEPIIFRDIKPSNIMINQYNHVVLVDFGIAKALKLGQRGTMMGTEGYSPPEQYRGEASPLVDIYALGATLHHLLTRCNPQLETPFTFADRPIHSFNKEVSDELVEVVNKALQYLPEDRYQAAAEMKDALQALVHKPTGTPVPVRSAVDAPAAVAATAPTPVVKYQDQEIQPLWIFKCEDEIRGTPTLENGVLYVGSYDNNLYALDGKTGDFIWKYPTEGAVVGRPATRESFLYIGSEDRMVYMISLHNGRPVWTYQTNGPVRSSPRLGEEYLFIGSDDGYMHAINVNSGRRLWRFEAGAPVRSTPFFFENLVYFGAESGDVYCVNLFGEMKWHFKAKRAVTSSPTLYDGLALFGSMDGNIYAIDARMGWEVWRNRMNKGSISTPCANGNYVYTGCIDGSIYCLDISNGREVWSFHTEHQVTGSPLFAGGWVYCGSVDGFLYCLDGKTGRLRWKFQTGGPITGTAILAEDVLYFGSTDHQVYALPI